MSDNDFIFQVSKEEVPCEGGSRVEVYYLTSQGEFDRLTGEELLQVKDIAAELHRTCTRKLLELKDIINKG